MPSSHDGLRRWVAPFALLLGITIAVVLIHNALSHDDSPDTTSTPTVAVTAPPPPARHPTTRAATTTTAAQYYVVQSGDTFGSIAAKEGTTVAALEQLNPGVSSTTLSVGQQIRVK